MWTVLFVVLGVIFGTGGKPGTDGPSAATGSKMAASPAAVGTPLGTAKLPPDFRRPYLQFRWTPGIDGEVCTEQDPWNAATSLGEMLAQDERDGRLTTEVLIASVPDPIDTRFSYRFDAELDALQMGIECQQWTYNSEWNPWRTNGRQISDRAALKPDQDGALGAAHTRMPAVLLFRRRIEADAKSTGPQGVLLLFLVGESPTSGLSKEALAVSLEVVRAQTRKRAELAGKNQGPMGAPTTIRMIAPYFSGSQASLEQAVNGWVIATEKAQAKNGTASPTLRWDLKLRAGAANRIDAAHLVQALKHNTTTLDVDFSATCLPFDVTMRGMLDFLTRLNGGKSLGKVALLTESDTAFGGPIQSDKILGSDYQSQTVVTTMKFPIHISQLAEAYEASESKNKTGKPDLLGPSSQLKIPFNEVGEPREEFPSLSPLMSSATDEFVVTKILETIATESYRTIGIVATDIHDLIFLTRMIRRYCPDVQIFTPGGELLLGHPQFASELRGLIVGSSYPMFSMAQRWDPPYEGGHRRHLFPSQGDQGVFNAAASLLGEKDRASEYFESLYDYGVPFDELEDLSLFWQGMQRRDGTVSPPWQPPGGAHANRTPWTTTVSKQNARPSLWLSVVGQRGLWPVEYIPSRPWEHSDANLPATGSSVFAAHYGNQEVDATAFVQQYISIIPQFTWEWGITALLLTVAAWILTTHHARPFLSKSAEDRAEARFQALKLIDPRIDPSGRGGPEAVHHEVLAIFGMLVFTATYAYVVLRPCWIAFRFSPLAEFLRLDILTQTPPGDRGLVLFGLTAIVLGHVTFASLILAMTRRTYSWYPRGQKAVVAVAIASAIAIAARHWWAGSFAWSDYGAIGWPYCHIGYTGNPAHTPLILGVALLAGVLLIAFAWRMRETLLGEILLLVACAWPFVVFLPAIFRLQWVYTADRFVDLLSLERSIEFGSGVTPLVPVLALMLITLAWVASQMRRIAMAHRFWGTDQTPRLQDYPYAVQWAVSLIRGILGVPGLLPGLLRETGGYLKVSLQSLRENTLPSASDREPEHASGQHGNGKRKPKKTSHPSPKHKTDKKNKTRHDSHPQQPHLTAEPQPAVAKEKEQDVVPIVILAVSQPKAESEAGATATVTVEPAAVEPPPVDPFQRRYQPSRESARMLVQVLVDELEQCIKLVRMMVPPQVSQRMASLAALAIGMLVFVRLWHRSVPTVDFPGWATLFILGWVWFLGLTVILSLARFVLIWQHLARLLREFARLPMIRAFDRLPPAFTRAFGRYLDRDLPYVDALAIPVRQWASVAEQLEKPELVELLRKAYLETAGKPSECESEQESCKAFERATRCLTNTPDDAVNCLSGPEAAEQIMRQFQHDCEEERKGPKSLVDIKTWPALRDASRACIDLLHPFWRSKSASTAFADPDEKGKPVDHPEEFPEANEDQKNAVALRDLLRAAEELVALELITYVSQIGAQLKNMATYLSVAPILLLLTVSTYPLQPARFLQVCLWSLVLIVVALVVWVYVAMERDALLSRVSKTTPNSIAFDRQFLGSVLTFIVPLLTVVMAQFPFFSDTLNQWLEPITRVLR